jgi:hypothetical protein
MTTLFRVEFFTADEDSHPTLMTRDEALAWLRTVPLTEMHTDKGVTLIEDLDDEHLGRAIVSATTNWIDESGAKWVRFIEKGLAEGGTAAVRADRIRFVRVTVEYDGPDEESDGDPEAPEEPEAPAGIRVDLPAPPNGWMN